MSWFARITFLPSLGYNLARNRWSSWNWIDRIDDQLVLGALPFHGPVTQHLYYREHIRSVVSMNEDFELRWLVTNRHQWNLMGVTYLQLNTSDIFHAPTRDQLVQGVQFLISQQEKPWLPPNVIDQQRNVALNPQIRIPFLMNPTIHGRQDIPIDRVSAYVHCKAGRTRSATLVACYLIRKYNLTPCESVKELKRLRKQVLLHRKQIEAIELFNQMKLANKAANVIVG